MSTRATPGRVPRSPDTGPRRHGVVLLILCLGFFMTVLDVTIVNIAVPDMISDLDSSFSQVLWVLNAYTLAFASLLLLSGRLGDTLGARRLLVFGLALFTAASAACGAAQEPWQLIAARAVQGVGAACLLPQTLSLLTVLTPPERRGRAFGIWGAIAGVALVAGPTLGGLLVTGLNWRWIFFVNVPVGVVTALLALRYIPADRARHRAGLDLTGVTLSFLALFCLTFGMIEGQRYDWGTIAGPVSIPAVLAAGAVLVVAFLVAERWRADRDPLLPLDLLRRRTYGLMNLSTALLMFAFAALLLLLTLYLQSVRNMSALAAGLTMSPTPLVAVLLSPVVGHFAGLGRGGKYAMVLGLVTVCGGLLWLRAIAGTDTGSAALLPPLLVAGLGMSLVLAPMNTFTMHGIPQETTGAASGLVSTARQLGTVFGVAAAGALLENRLAHELPAAVARHSATLPPALRPVLARALEGSGDLVSRLGADRAAPQPPPGLPPGAAGRLREAADAVSADALLEALRTTLLLPAAVLGVAVLVTLAVRAPARPADPA
ncbi:MFS transporter [Streptomyces sp. NPDC003077]|uniref:MFS transporter n=1 Tax=Streptomyces sp. NPDC003077 TaxID=3154443 RepID=UPI0033A060C2